MYLRVVWWVICCLAVTSTPLVQFPFRSLNQSVALNTRHPDWTGPLVLKGVWSDQHRGVQLSQAASLNISTQLAALCQHDLALELWFQLDDANSQGSLFEWRSNASSLTVSWTANVLRVHLAVPLATQGLALDVPMDALTNHLVLNGDGQVWLNNQRRDGYPLLGLTRTAGQWTLASSLGSTSTTNRTRLNRTRSMVRGSETWWLYELNLYNSSMSATEVERQFQLVQAEFPAFRCPPNNFTLKVPAREIFVSGQLPSLAQLYGDVAPTWPRSWRVIALGPGNWTTSSGLIQVGSELDVATAWFWAGTVSTTRRTSIVYQFEGQIQRCRSTLAFRPAGSRRISILPVIDIYLLLVIISSGVVTVLLFLTCFHRQTKLESLLFKGASLHAGGVALGFVLIDSLYYRQLLEEGETQAWYASFAVFYMIEATCEFVAYLHEYWWMAGHLYQPVEFSAAWPILRWLALPLIRVGAEVGNMVGATVYLGISFVHDISTRTYTEWELVAMLGYSVSAVGYLGLSVDEHYFGGWALPTWKWQIVADVLNTAACAVYTSVLLEQLTEERRGLRHKHEFPRLAYTSGYLFLASAICYVTASFHSERKHKGKRQ